MHKAASFGAGLGLFLLSFCSMASGVPAEILPAGENRNPFADTADGKVIEVFENDAYPITDIVGGRREIEVVGFSRARPGVLVYRVHYVYRLKSGDDGDFPFDAMSLLVAEDLARRKILRTFQWEWKRPNKWNPRWSKAWKAAAPADEGRSWLKEAQVEEPARGFAAAAGPRRLSLLFRKDSAGLDREARLMRLIHPEGEEAKYSEVEGYSWKSPGGTGGKPFGPELALGEGGKEVRVLKQLRISAPRGMAKQSFSKDWRAFWDREGDGKGNYLILVEGDEYHTPSKPIFEDFKSGVVPLYHVVLERLRVFDIRD